MKKSALLALSLFVSSAAFASPECTVGDKSNWIDENTMKQQITDEGYTVHSFRVSESGCYEVEAVDSDGQNVELYYHPETGDQVGEEASD